MPMGIGLGIGVTRGGGVGWWQSGSALDLDFANSLGFNSIDRTKLTPDSILTYTNPSAKVVYGSDGVLRYAPHNLLLQSQTFETASWTKGNCTVTANAAVAPDGTTTADFIIPNAASASYKTVQHANNVNPGVAVATASIYAKTNGYGFISFVATSSLGRLTIELSTGAYTNYGAALTATSTAVGDGWYRVVVNVPSYTVSASVWWGPNSAQRDPAISWTSDGVSGAYLWGAQLVAGSNALTYIPTTTAAVYSLSIDHNPTTFAPLGVLIEEQRTNLLTYSEQFDNAAWVKTGATVTANQSVAPDGTTTADQVASAAPSTNLLSQSVSPSSPAGKTYTFSIWLKGVSGNVSPNLQLRFLGTVDGTTSSVAGSPSTSVWTRYSVTKTFSGSETGPVFCRLADAIETFNVYAWGAQLEEGAFPTSYIPTVASQVTRLADQVSILTSAFAYSQTAGTIYAEADSYNVNGTTWSLSDGTNNERIVSLTGANYHLGVFDNGVQQAAIDVGTIPTNGTQYKGAAAFAADGFGFSLNGGTVGTAPAGTIPTVTSLRLGMGASTTTVQISGHIKRLTYFPTRRTDADLQVLTT